MYTVHCTLYSTVRVRMYVATFIFIFGKSVLYEASLTVALRRISVHWYILVSSVNLQLDELFSIYYIFLSSLKSQGRSNCFEAQPFTSNKYSINTANIAAIFFAWNQKFTYRTIQALIYSTMVYIFVSFGWPCSKNNLFEVNSYLNVANRRMQKYTVRLPTCSEDLFWKLLFCASLEAWILVSYEVQSHWILWISLRVFIYIGSYYR